MKDFLGRGWRFPFGFDPATGAVAMSAHEDNIRESITIVLGTRPGERQMLPEFGCKIHDMVFTPNTQANAALVSFHVEQALARWEPRIQVIGVEATPDGQGTMRVRVRYKIRATQAEDALGFDLPTGG